MKFLMTLRLASLPLALPALSPSFSPSHSLNSPGIHLGSALSLFVSSLPHHLIDLDNTLHHHLLDLATSLPQNFLDLATFLPHHLLDLATSLPSSYSFLPADLEDGSRTTARPETEALWCGPSCVRSYSLLHSSLLSGVFDIPAPPGT